MHSEQQFGLAMMDNVSEDMNSAIASRAAYAQVKLS